MSVYSTITSLQMQSVTPVGESSRIPKSYWLYSSRNSNSNSKSRIQFWIQFWIQFEFKSGFQFELVNSSPWIQSVTRRPTNSQQFRQWHTMSVDGDHVREVCTWLGHAVRKIFNKAVIQASSFHKHITSSVVTDAYNITAHCCPTNYELLRRLVETPSRDFEHYRMTDNSRQSIIWHFHVTIGFARWRFNLFECRRRMLQRHLLNRVERTQLRSPDCW